MIPDRRAAAVLVSLVTGAAVDACAPTVDIVAASGDASPAMDAQLPADAALEARDVAAPLDAGTPDTLDVEASTQPDVGPLDAGAPACVPAVQSVVYVATQGGEILRFDPDPKSPTVTSLGVPDCFKIVGGFTALAVDPTGIAWVVGGTGQVEGFDVAQAPLTCKEMPTLKLPPNGAFITFLPPPAGARAPLYVAEGATLLSVDTQSGIEAPIGSLAEKGLVGMAGTGDGRLYALRPVTNMSSSAALDLIDPGTAAVMSTLTVPLQGASVLYGGASTGGQMILLADSYYFTVDLVTDQVTGPSKALMPFVGVAAVAAAPCPATG